MLGPWSVPKWNQAWFSCIQDIGVPSFGKAKIDFCQRFYCPGQLLGKICYVGRKLGKDALDLFLLLNQQLTPLIAHLDH
jgi:hypothetical protein